MTQRAKEKFRIGDRVQMTQAAIDTGLHGPKANRRTGIVRGFAESEFYEPRDVLVKVRRDGEERLHTYHMDFWELCE